METKILDLILKPFKVLQEVSSPPENPPVSGWYLDPASGQRLFYDAGEGKFYTMAGGVYIPLGYMNPSPKQVALAPGDRLQITLSFKYTGPAITGVTGYYCIGVYGTFGFNETMVGQTSFNIPQVTTPPSSPNVTNSYTFTIPANIGTDWDDIYVKIFGGTPSLGSSALTSYLFGYENALIIVGTNPTISEFKISDFIKV